MFNTRINGQVMPKISIYQDIKLMSALGQKQTCAAHKLMSALPPIATAKADMPQW
jgi:hypothetical protein